ncbi:MAG: cupin domain-containing protein [Anaerolineae bacterium]|nr:cupin domain-containing protein [Anaerolineae bacterium]
MTLPYHFHSALQELITIQPDSIVSRTFFEDETVKVVLFGFAAKQALSQHTSSKAAMLHIVSGDAQLTLGDNSYEVQSSAWVQMPPHLPHSVVAKTDMLMLLYMLKGCPK